MASFSGIWVPLVTPFAPDGSVDRSGLTALVRSLTAAGVHGLVVCGTTGESDTLSDDEKAQVLATVLGACGDRPVVMGVKSTTPNDVGAQCRRWSGAPIAGFLVPPPPYVRPSQPGVIQFYAEVAQAAAPLPIIVYDIPYRTGVTLALATMRALARIPGVRAVKDCGGDAGKTQTLIADGQLDVLAGEDALIFSTLCQGGTGAIAAAAHLHPERFVALHDAVCAQRLHDARALHHALAPMAQALFAEPNPAPLKAVLAHCGAIGATVRAPMTLASAAAAQAAIEAFTAAGAAPPPATIPA
jgi:4-hydroxy-tetrahydrodipicolinate synthase